MARGKFGETLQAVEINSGTTIGILSNERGAGDQIHMMVDGDLTFHFSTGDISLTGLVAGSDYVAGPGCTGITSSATILVS